MIISIIVPVYNEEKTIIETLEKLNEVKFHTLEKEIIVIDDGSIDSTKKLLNENQNLFNLLINYDVNKGKGYAVKMGIKKSTGTYITFQDADSEYDPNDLLKFEKIFLKFNADGIIGSRFKFKEYTRSHNFVNKVGNFIITLLFNVLYNTTFTDIYSCYFAFKKELINANTLSQNGFAQHAEILCKVVKRGNKFYETPINYNGRTKLEGKKIRYYHFFNVIKEILLRRFL